jgi:hypothetical protein
MTRFARLREVLAAYGAAPRRWPAEERSDAERLLASSAEAKILSREAAALDALLDQAPRPALPRIEAAALAAGISARPQAPARRRLQDMIWLRAVGLAAAALIGFVVGTTQLADLGEQPAASPAPIDVAEISPW